MTEDYDLINIIKNNTWNAPWLDFSIFHYEKEKLIIVASDDFSYYHNMEIRIDFPVYVQGYMEWSCDISDDFIRANIGLNEEDIKNNAINSLTFFSEDKQMFTIVAKSFSVNFDTVFYYKRENLLPQQRLAYWVK